MKLEKIIVIGAGPSGLATALGLAERGFEVAVYDAAEIVGGLAGSEVFEGMTVDYGPHIYHTDDEETESLWRDLFGDLLEEKEFFSKNFKDGVLYDYPLSHESIERFPPDVRKKVKEELASLRPQDMMRASNFKEVVAAIVGPTLQELFFEAYTQKLWGIPTVKMSAKWAPKRIEIRKEHRSFWYNQYSAAAIYGSGAVMNRLVERIEAKGGRVHLKHEVKELVIRDSQVSSVKFANGKEIDTKNSTIVSTIPLNNLCAAIGLKCGLRFNSVILAYLIFEKDFVLPDNVQSIYFAHEATYFHRVSEQKKFSAKTFPKDKTILTFEISYTNKAHLLNLTEEQLLKEVLEQFSSLGFVEEKDYITGFTRRWDSINPILELGFEDEFVRVNSFISNVRNLHTVGGSAEFVYGDVQVMFRKAKDLVDLLTSEHYVINKNIKAGEAFRFNKEVEIGQTIVGGDHPTLIIAEIGLNHNGDVGMARELIDKAQEVGCNYAKLQTYEAKDRVSELAKGAKYADKTLDMEETLHEMFKRVALTREETRVLFDYAKEIGMDLISTPFSESDVDFLMEMEVDALKIASFDIVNLPFIRYAASKKIPLIISTGMSGMTEVEEALDAVAKERNPNVILLHCISSYPTSPIDVNLRAVETLKNAFKVPVGYSDHTIGTLVPTIAMSTGSDVLEKHFTLNTHFEGSDHILSATPTQMREIVENRNTIFTALGSGIKKPRPIEYIQVNQQRKSIFLSKDVSAGDILELGNITIKGPGHGILPKYLNLVLGKRVLKDIPADHPLSWEDLLSS